MMIYDKDERNFAQDDIYYKKMLKQIGRNIKSYRKSHHLLQTDLAEKLHVSASTITNIERGTVGITSKMMYMLAQEFHIHVAQLFLDEDVVILSKKQLFSIAFSEKFK